MSGDDRPATKEDLDRLEDRLTARLDRMDAARERDMQGLEDDQAKIRARVMDNEKRVSRHNGLFWLVGLMLTVLVAAVVNLSRGLAL